MPYTKPHYEHSSVYVKPHYEYESVYVKPHFEQLNTPYHSQPASMKSSKPKSSPLEKAKSTSKFY